MNPECVTCRFISQCATVTPEKVLAHFVCANYKEVETQAEVKARCDVITRFGESGLRAVISPEVEEE